MKKIFFIFLAIFLSLTIFSGCSSSNTDSSGIFVRVENQITVGGTPRDIRLYSISGYAISGQFDSDVVISPGGVSSWIDISDGAAKILDSYISVSFKYWTSSGWSSIETGRLYNISGIYMYRGEQHTGNLNNID